MNYSRIFQHYGLLFKQKPRKKHTEEFLQGFCSKRENWFDLAVNIGKFIQNHYFLSPRNIVNYLLLGAIPPFKHLIENQELSTIINVSFVFSKWFKIACEASSGFFSSKAWIICVCSIKTFFILPSLLTAFNPIS
jgi:phage anti-repressor protein